MIFLFCFIMTRCSFSKSYKNFVRRRRKNERDKKFLKYSIFLNAFLRVENVRKTAIVENFSN
ncbi:hypothetical protein FQR65_LT13120 [Abscondita terminalis]|nr:hypothetical protein FQR65_LT13120 [Abscondita terminalis]